MGRVAVRQVGVRMSEAQALASAQQALALGRLIRDTHASKHTETYIQARRACVELAMLIECIITPQCTAENAT